MRVKSGLVLFVIPILLSGCNRVTTVRSVQDHPHRNWFTSTVYLQGTVAQQAPLLEAQLYQLQDSTGKIWVLSRKPPLQPGQSIRIQGQVRYESIEIGGTDFGEVYIEEQQQLQPEP